MGYKFDLTGRKFGRLEVIRHARYDKNNASLWECKCDCGNITVARGGDLKSGNTLSCGCLRKDHGGGLENIRKTNICIDCQKACGGCSWSRSFTPVEGWTAEKVVIRNGIIDHKVRNTETYHIIECPEFVRDKPRSKDKNENREQFKKFVAALAKLEAQR